MRSCQDEASAAGVARVVGGDQARTGQHAVDTRAHIDGIVLRGATQDRFGTRLKIQVVEIRIFICLQLGQLFLQRVQARGQFFAGGHARLRQPKRYVCGSAVKDVRSLALQRFTFLPVAAMKARSTLTALRR